jgi:hypothetical protein
MGPQIQGPIARSSHFYTTSFKMPSMSTLRPPLGPIDGNITRGKELTPKMRNKACTLVKASHKIPYIMGRYKLSRGAVRYTLDHEASRPQTNTSLPRPGAKKMYNHLDERNLLRHACQNPKQNICPAEESRGGVLLPQSDTPHPLGQ